MPYLAVVLVATLMATAALASPQPVVDVLQDRARDVLFSVQTRERVIALTIDDGPSEATPGILRVLNDHGARATFFLIGEHIDADPDGARSIIEEGHEVANHLLRDEASIHLPPEEFTAQLLATAARLTPLGGAPFLRPGSGWLNARMVTDASARDHRVVLGSVYPFDAQLPAPALIAWYVLRNVRPGSIVVLHDGPGRGERTARVLRSVLPALEARGFRVVTVSELLDAAEGSSVEATLQ